MRSGIHGILIMLALTHFTVAFIKYYLLIMAFLIESMQISTLKVMSDPRNTLT